ncbi:MAG: hypothetical protein ABII82_00345, partial [Verrucomicrobiota bacterium]
GASAGSEVTFDMQTHLREIEDYLPQAVNFGREYRNSEEGIEIDGSLLAVCEPPLMNEIVDDAKDDRRVTMMMATSLDAAMRKKYFADTGFDGAMYRSPSLPPIAFQADEMCAPHTMYLLEPKSFFFVYAAGGQPGGMNANINWLAPSGVRWHMVHGATMGTPTANYQAGTYQTFTVTCDQPPANVCLKHIKSSAQ